MLPSRVLFLHGSLNSMSAGKAVSAEPQWEQQHSRSETGPSGKNWVLKKFNRELY